MRPTEGELTMTPTRMLRTESGGDIARECLDAFLTPTKATPTVAHTVAQDPNNEETPVNAGVSSTATGIRTE